MRVGDPQEVNARLSRRNSARSDLSAQITCRVGYIKFLSSPKPTESSFY